MGTLKKRAQVCVMMDERLDNKRYNQKLVGLLFPEKKNQKSQQFVLFVGINHV